MNKVIIITGASSGFGKAIAERLAKGGHKVYGICRRAMDNNAITYMQGDVRDSERIKQIVKEIYEKEQRIDVLINNAGMGIGGALEMAKIEEIQTQMGVNFMGCVNMCQQVLPYMRKQRHGRIINLSSIGDFATNFTASRKNSESTLNDPDYGPIYKRSLGLIEKEENGGLSPDVLARKIEKIVDARHPRLRYVVANFEQWLSVVLKRFIPGNWFVNILVYYYKTKP